VHAIEKCFEVLRRFGRKLGPYLMLEILLPGGTLFALLLFLYQRRTPQLEDVSPLAMTWAFASAVRQCIFNLRRRYATTLRLS
jgi:hypothetical protein